ncbi:MAG: hypothetical protein J7K88_04700 [Candidatus Fermentibacteraceae bacterium]|nr:hypothetical protein [Candidatus Fermentibacteraceae bacterium]
MKNSTRGVLWSALVFPGSGQIVLNHRKRGAVFALLSIAAVVAMIVTVVRGTWSGLESIALQGGEITLSSMGAVAASSLKTVKTHFLLPIALLWLINITDAWYTGKKTPGGS